MEGELWKKALEMCMVRLESDLSFGDISSHLIANADIGMTPAKCQEIVKATCCRRSQTERLLDLLDRKTRRDYDIFLDSLKDQCDHLHKILQVNFAVANDKPDQAHWRTVLQRCRLSLVSDLDVNDIKNKLIQERVLTTEEVDRVMCEPDPSTRSEKVRLFLNHLCRREQEDYDVFLRFLNQQYDFLKKLLDEDVRQLELEADPEKMPYWKVALTSRREKLVEHLDIRDFKDVMISKRVINSDQLEECTVLGGRTRRNQVRGFTDYLRTRTKSEFDAFLEILDATNYGHLKTALDAALTEVTRQADLQVGAHFPAQETGPVGSEQGEDIGDAAFVRTQPPSDCLAQQVAEAAESLEAVHISQPVDEVDNRTIEQIREQRRLAVADEPPQGSGFTVRFCLPSGLQRQRRFAFDSTAKNLIDFVGSLEDVPEHFTLHAHGVDAIDTEKTDILSMTLQELKITANTRINVRWKTDPKMVFAYSVTSSGY